MMACYFFFFLGEDSTTLDCFARELKIFLARVWVLGMCWLFYVGILDCKDGAV